ncbi:hypothetical protein [Actinophytocola sediminis]
MNAYSGNQNLRSYEIPQSADSPAGATFFEQYHRDLIWAIGQEIVTRNVESFTQFIIDALKRAEPPAGTDTQSWQQVLAVMTKSIGHEAKFARQVVDINAPTVAEAGLCRYVDNFLCYLSDLLGQILVQVPDVLLTEAQISVQDVFNHQTLEDFQRWLIEKKINSLSFQGLESIEKYYQKSFGLTLFTQPSVRSDVSLAVAARNLLVHRRGIIDDRFIKMAGTGAGKRDERVKVAHRVWVELVPAILETVRDVDRRAAEKFGFQAAMVVVDHQVSAGQQDLFEDIARDVMGWRMRSKVAPPGHAD